MLRDLVLIYYRSTMSHLREGSIALLGLALGIAVMLIMGLAVRFEAQYDAWIPGANKIYQVQSARQPPGETENFSPGMVGSFLDDIKQTDSSILGTRIFGDDATLRVGSDREHAEQSLVDGDFFRVFGLPLKEGERANALLTPDSVVLSATMAKRLFGTKPALGRVVDLIDEERQCSCVVTAVLEETPKNTRFKFDIVRLLSPGRIARESNWSNYGIREVTTYLALEHPNDVARLDRVIAHFAYGRPAHTVTGTPISTPLDFRLKKLTSLHLADPKAKATVAAIGFVGLLTFIIATINYVNLATARARYRATEVAIRQAVGASRLTLIVQFIGEATINMMLALLFAASVVELTLPMINRAGGLALSIDYRHDWRALCAFALTVCLAGAISGAYPALVMARFQPAQVLASSRRWAFGTTSASIREGLVALQFGFVTASLIVLYGIVCQLQQIRTSDPGFRSERLLIVDSLSDDGMSDAQRSAFLQAASSLPGVTDVAAADRAAGDADWNWTRQLSTGDDSLTVNGSLVGPGFFSTYGVHLLAGRSLDRGFGLDAINWENLSNGSGPPVVNVMLNSSAIRAAKLGTPDQAVGRILALDQLKIRVVGIIGDLRFGPPTRAVAPMVYFLSDRPLGIASIRFAGIDEPTARQNLRSLWREIAPEVPFQISSAEVNLDNYITEDRHEMHLFAIGAGLSALIGCFGLYGLAAFNVAKRAHEVGVRKICGATTGAILRLLINRSLRPVLLANLAAWPIAAWILPHWLSRFDRPLPLSAAHFLGPSLAVLLVALLTIAGFSFAAARATPAKILREG